MVGVWLVRKDLVMESFWKIHLWPFGGEADVCGASQEMWVQGGGVWGHGEGGPALSIHPVTGCSSGGGTEHRLPCCKVTCPYLLSG